MSNSGVQKGRPPSPVKNEISKLMIVLRTELKNAEKMPMTKFLFLLITERNSMEIYKTKIVPVALLFSKQHSDFEPCNTTI